MNNPLVAVLVAALKRKLSVDEISSLSLAMHTESLGTHTNGMVKLIGLNANGSLQGKLIDASGTLKPETKTAIMQLPLLVEGSTND